MEGRRAQIGEGNLEVGPSAPRLKESLPNRLGQRLAPFVGHPTKRVSEHLHGCARRRCARGEACDEGEQLATAMTGTARSLERVTQAADGVPAGLSERKRMRTRSQLVGAAIELSRKHGFVNATIDQIAAAVDVSPRTFSRYFATKEAAILSVIRDMAETAIVHLGDVDPQVGPLDALVEAHRTMLEDVHSGRHVVTPLLLAGALLVIGESPVLRPLALGFTPAGLLHEVARRMGVGPDDRAPWLVMRVWLSILSCASREVGMAVALGHCDATLTANAMSQRITDVRSEVAALVPPVPDRTPPTAQPTWF